MRMGVAGTAWAVVGLLAGPAAFALPSSNAPNPADDGKAVVEEVGRQLLSLPYYSVFDTLSFRVDGSKVTLSGQVTQPVVKEDAERMVRRVPGVQTVVDQIEVLPISRTDDQVRRAVYYAVYGYAPLERYGLGSQPAIRIIVKGGRVTLTGTVASQVDRLLVYQRANSVPGVFSVTNQLMVEA